MNGEFISILESKIADSLATTPPALTRRSVHIPAVPGKALAVIGMRRAGKTSLLWQMLAERLAAGEPRSTLLYLNFEDERLAGLTAADLSQVTELYFRLHPEWRDRRQVLFLLDEIQVVPGWEAYVRRLLDTERVDLRLSGSSAKLLSREVATSMRGRALEVLVHPFSFREALRHANAEPRRAFSALPKAARSSVEKRLGEYLVAGGFPEAQGLAARDRGALLKSYVDVALLRDVVERHAVSNPTALRWMLRHLLCAPAAPFSAQKFYDALRSQGIAVAKDTVHAYLSHLEDAFLVRCLSVHASSERQRMVNPRKAYPIDPGLIPLYERSGRANLGAALETAVLLELERRGAELAYLRTASGYEVDFYARMPDGAVLLVQVCARLETMDTLQREIRALVEASAEHPETEPWLITLDPMPRGEMLPARVRHATAAAFLLGSSA